MRKNTTAVDEMGYLAIGAVSRDSLQSAHSESKLSYRADVDEKHAKRLVKANNHVSDSSELN